MDLPFSSPLQLENDSLFAMAGLHSGRAAVVP
jgi:hypothetical protein